ncbi:succinate dehydrogenase, cytochrome b556 subunit [Acidocella sp.]|uniref:succinate dehydrogenase, cytochrome b556 subunit n=1 Tax=Acidocella sp. TaxID=50710 RepID=UPI00262CCD8F|nr:succinate dehydrogenase, cytochrome b556 subunit [Acidocella sp.]MDD2794719.1 succinate dehydrogenase, cytochrome b556 subunit [Acidocella sp.]
MKDVREALMVGRNTEGKLVRRPLSPHLQVYKPQLSSVTSVFHRGTGIALGAGALLLTAWLVSAAAGDAAFSVVRALLASWIGLLVLVGFTLALFYHFCNGIRHLFWDSVRGFELEATHRNGRMVIAGAVVLTVVFWFVGFLVW